MLNIVEVNTFDELLELRYIWNRLLARSRDNNIFLTWEYLSTWWRHFGSGKELRTLVIEDSNEIIAIAPLRSSRYGFASVFSYNVIEPMGYRGLMPEGGDYTGLILGEREAECLQLFLMYLVEHDGWDFIYMHDVQEVSRFPDLLQKITTAKFEIEKGSICPYMPLPSSTDILFKGFSKKFRNNLRRCMRNLEKDYGKVQVKKYDEFDSVEETMKTLFKLNQKRWGSRSTLGTFKTQDIRDFYIDVANIFDYTGWLALCFLMVKDEPVAALYCFEYDQKMLAAIIGFDPDYSRYSVGNLLFLKVIEECMEKGLKEFDFMKGDEPYKFGWTGKYRRNVNIRFVNEKFTSNLYHWGIKTINQAKIGKTLERLPIFREKGKKH